MKQNSVQDLTLLGLLTALVAVSTMIISIPVPSTEGFIHLGDSMIFLTAIIFGKRKGAIAAGLGSALADILLGYTHWALPTLVIKGLMGYWVGAIARQNEDQLLQIRNITALLVGALWMVFGYFIAGAALKGSFLVSLTSVPANLLQGFGGALLFVPIGIGFAKTKYLKKYAAK
ncbi:ECF transporter S component [Alkaliphilus crotonatoxidans]